jgi:hypothetical protein
MPAENPAGLTAPGAIVGKTSCCQIFTYNTSTAPYFVDSKNEETPRAKALAPRTTELYTVFFTTERAIVL